MRALLFCIALFCSFPLIGQTSFGLKGGYNGAGVNTVFIPTFIDNGESPAIRHQWYHLLHLGIWGRIQVRPKAAVQTELLYVPKVWAVKNVAGNRVDMDYIVLPIIIQFQPNRLGIGIGPELGYSLKQGNEELVLDNPAKVSLGLTMDLSYQFTNKWRINFRYSRDLTPFSSFIINAVDPNGTIFNERMEFKNRSIQLALSYQLFAS